MARLAFAAFALLSLFLLAAGERLPSEVQLFQALRGDDAAAIRLPSERPSDESVSKSAVDAFLPVTDKPNDISAIIKPEEDTDVNFQPFNEKPLSEADDDGSRAVPLEVSLIPVGDLSFAHRREFARPSWSRLGRHCHRHHIHRILRGDIRRGDFIPYGDDMIIPDEQVRRANVGGRFFSEEARNGHFHQPMEMHEISAEELEKLKEMGVPRELRPFRRFPPHHHHHHHFHGEDEEDGGFLKRFLHFLNRH